MAEEQFVMALGGADSADRPVFDPDEIRSDALAILAEAQAATAERHSDAATLRYRRAMFPHLVAWLPDEERDQLRFEFAQKADRIERLLAA